MAGPLVQTELSRLLGRSSEQLPCSKPSVLDTTSGRRFRRPVFMCLQRGGNDAFWH
jgi:hypothetical protein